jgi:hypothetical protein
MIFDSNCADPVKYARHVPACCAERREFSGSVYRATGISADPLAPSNSGGRWAPPSHGDGSFPILYEPRS